MKRLQNIHPGEILSEEFLIPMQISPYKLAKETGLPQSRVSAIINCRRSVTADTAIRLSYFFGNSAKFWLGLQADFDLEEVETNNKASFSSIKKFSNNAA